MRAPKDKHGIVVSVGTRVRLLGLAGQWLDRLPDDEKKDVLSMIGETFEVEEIDEYGQAWVRKSWFDATGGVCNSHSIGLESHEMEVVSAAAA